MDLLARMRARSRAAHWRRAAVAQDRNAVRCFRWAADARDRGDTAREVDHIERALWSCARGTELRYRAADEVER